jgi:hypothetical protein
VKFYAFLWRRQCDSQAWPLIFTDKEAAANHRERVSPVVEVELEETMPVLANFRPWQSNSSGEKRE